MNIEQLARKIAPHSMMAQVALEGDSKHWGSALIDYIRAKASELGLNDDPSIKSIAVVDGEFIIKFPVDEDLKVILQRQVDGIRFLKSKQHWHVKASLLNAEAVKHFAEVNNFVLDYAATEAITNILSEAKKNLEGSHKSVSSFQLKGGFEISLRGYQVAGVEYATRAHKTLIADEPGIGKTFQALATVHHNNAFPCLVISPATYKYGWEAEIKRALPHASILVCDSKSHIQYSLLWSTYDFYIVNYDLLSSGWDGEDKKNVKLSDLALAFKDRGLKGIIADESHYVKNPTAQRSIASCALADGTDIRLALTGTPVDNRPVELVGQLMFINRLRDFGSAWKFKKRYCDAKQKMIKGRLTWDTTGSSNTKELGDLLRSSCMVRRLKKDVLTELPDKQNVILPVELDNRSEYDTAEFDVVKFVRDLALKDQAYRQTLGHLSSSDADLAMVAYANSKERRAQRALALTKFNVLKKTASKGKMRHIIEWANNFLESGNKLVIFAFYIETQKELVKAFPGCATVLGEMSPELRFKEVERFQSDSNCNVIVCSLMAAAEAITLTAASDVLLAELPWSPGRKTQAEDRLHRVTQKNAVTVYDMLARNTIEEDNYQMIEDKRKVCEAILDGTYNADENYIELMMDKLLAKRGVK